MVLRGGSNPLQQMRPHIGSKTNALVGQLPVPLKAHPRPVLRAAAHPHKLASDTRSNDSSSEGLATRSTLESIDLLLGSADEGDKASSAGIPAKGDAPSPMESSDNRSGDALASPRYACHCWTSLMMPWPHPPLMCASALYRPGAAAGLTKTLSTMAKDFVADKLKRPSARDLVVEEDADALTLVLSPSLQSRVYLAFVNSPHGHCQCSACMPRA